MPEHINLRGDPGEAAFLSAARGVLGFELPLAANTTAQSNEHVACWLGPNEWLVATHGEGARLAAALRDALGASFSSVTEVGGGNAVFVLAGPTARDRLAQECPLDLDPSTFRPGQCAQTRFAKAAVLLRPLDNGDIELTVRRSFADYLMHWIDTQPCADPRREC